MFEVTDKVALVTGATGGIGASVAKALHSQGAAVILSGTRENVLQELAAEIGDNTYCLPCNLYDAESVNGLIKQAEEMAGSVDILVNNAGITRDNLALRMKDEDWDDVINVNLTSCFKLTRNALKGMMKRRWGRVVNISSVVGVAGNPGQANYVAAKAGMIGMSKSFAAEVATRRITINCVAPGFIATPMTDVLNDKQRESILASIPAGKLGTSDDIAAAVAFLASDAANYITGQTIHVNGGMLMV